MSPGACAWAGPWKGAGMAARRAAVAEPVIEELRLGVLEDATPDEIEAHLDFLRGLGCEALQGYLFCRPLAAVSFESLLTERERLYEDLRISSQPH